MLGLKLIFLLFLFKNNLSVEYNGNGKSIFSFSNVFVLTANFFTENFNDTSFSGNNKMLNKTEKHLVDEWVDNYLKRIQKSVHETAPIPNHMINKREIAMNIPGVYIFNRMEEIGQIKTHFPLDILMIKLKQGFTVLTYIVTIESEYSLDEAEKYLNIYRYETNDFTLIHKENIKGAIKLETFVYADESYLIVARKQTLRSNLYENGSIIYKINPDGSLILFQTIFSPYANDIIVWSSMNEIFLIILENYKLDQNNLANYEIELPIYRWAGKHFDILHTIDVNNPKRITAFTIEGFNYIAVANYQNNYDETDIFSEIFRYAVQQDKFISHQKIMTHAAIDVNCFNFQSNNQIASYLIFGNSYEIGFDGTKITNTNSVIYKFVEDYFIPFQSLLLNDVTNLYSMQGSNNEFLLLTFCKTDLARIFQYDGWQFVELEFRNIPEILQRGVTSLRYYNIENNIITFVTNEFDEGNLINILTPKFIYQNMVHNYYDDMENWSMEMTTLINEQNSYIENLMGQMNVDFEDFGFLNIHDETDHIPYFMRIKNQIEEEIHPTVQQLNDIDTELDQINIILDQLENQFDNSIEVDNNDDIILSSDVHFDEIILNCHDETCNFDNINIETLNDNLNIDEFFQNIYPIDSDGNCFIDIIDPIEFEDLLIDTKIEPKSINNHNIEDLIYTDRNNFIIENFILNGEIIFDNEFNVNGFIDDVKIDTNHVIINNLEQIFTGDLQVDEIMIKNLNSPTINKLNFSKESQQYQNTTLLQPKQIFAVQTENLIIGDLLNDIDLDVIDKYGLRKIKNNQIITGDFRFSELNVNELITDSFISNKKIPDDLIPINIQDDTQYFIDQDIDFIDDLDVNDLQILEQINQVKVIDNKLDILLRNISDKQFISGRKIFHNVNLSGPLQLQGHIRSGVMEQMNPVSMINDQVLVEGDFVISGNVTIENIVECLDMKDDLNIYSFGRLHQSGLVLGEVVPIPLTFQQQMHVNELIVQSINHENPSDWLVMGTDKSQVILGEKIIPNNLMISSGSIVENINDINLSNLNENMLKTDGLQIIDGKMVFENVIATRIKTNSTFFKDINLDQIKMLENLQINGSISVTDHINANRLRINNQIIDSNLESIDGENAIIIESSDEFTDEMIEIENLNQVQTINNYSISEILPIFQIWEKEIHLNESMEFENMNVDQLYFTDSFDQIDNVDFGEWFLQDYDQYIDTKQILKNVTVNGNLNLANGIVNNVNIIQFFENLIFLDEDEFLDNVVFESELISNNEITIDGNVTGIKFSENVLVSNVDNDDVHYLNDTHFIFNNDLIIDGNLIVNNRISGVNWNNLHKFRSNENLERVTINGNIKLNAEPNIENLNSRNVNEMYDNVWYQSNDENDVIDLYGIFDFNEIICENDIDLIGNLNGYNLQWLQENYFSLTNTEQQSNGTLHFEDGVIFQQNLYGNQSIINGFICEDIRLDEFAENVLQYDVDQVIFNEMNFDNLIVTENFNVAGKVNDLNLNEDVLRHDIPENLITGPKIVKDIITYNINSPHELVIQNLDINNWMNESILLTHPNQFYGSVEFKFAKFLENINLQGLVNGEFLFDDDHVLLKNTPQIITGQKKFLINETIDNLYNVHFKNLQMKKSLNGYNVTHLLQNQAFNNENNIFTGSHQINNLITAQNINIDNDIFGINKTDIFNIINLPQMNYLEQQYSNLSENSKKFITNLEGQAFYLDGYEVVDTNDYNILSFEIENQNYFLQILNENHQMKIDMYFPISHAILGTLNFTSDSVSLIRLLNFNDLKYLCIETEVNDLSDNFSSHLAKFYQLNKNGFSLNYGIATNGTKDIVSFSVPDTSQSCLLLLSENNDFSQIYCQDDNTEQPQAMIQIPSNSPKDVETLIINKILYIFIINTDLNQQLTNTVNVWRLSGVDDNQNAQLIQIIHNVAQPNSLTAINYINNNNNKELQLLAIASGHLQDTIHTGLIDIKRFDETTNQFETIQKLHLKSPIYIQFTILPTNELILYALTENPTESLIVYLYQGLYNFVPKTVAPTIINGLNLQVITNFDLNHYVVVNSNNSSKIMKAVIQGH